MPCRPAARTNTDKGARGYNAAVRRETDYWREARAYRDRYAEVSRQNATSTGNPRATPWRQTRFANRFEADRARRMADAGLDHPAWLSIRTLSTSCRR